MGKVIAICNQKGGVGKTTTTLNLGSELAQKGYKVLLVDFDHQANLTLSCGVEDYDNMNETIADYMEAIIDGQTVYMQPLIYRDNLDLIPANIRLANVNLELIQAMAREFMLKNLLEPLRGQYDFILIDCAPSLSVDMINALTAADEVLIVSTPSKFSTAGMKALIQSILRVRKNLNQNLTLTGVLINKVDRRNNFTRDMIEVMNKTWGEDIKIFGAEIPASIRVEESQAMAKPIREYEPSNKSAAAYGEFTKEFIEEA